MHYFSEVVIILFYVASDKTVFPIPKHYFTESDKYLTNMVKTSSNLKLRDPAVTLVT